MAGAVRVPDLHFCEIGQERDGVTVDIGQLPAIKGRHSVSAVPIAIETAEVAVHPWTARQGTRAVDSSPWRRFCVSGDSMADENRFCASMGGQLELVTESTTSNDLVCGLAAHRSLSGA
jgi:hypothetical protein